MKKEKPHAVDVEEILKRALKDDLPAEAKRRMQRRLTMFRKRIEEPARGLETRPAGFWQRLFRPQARPMVARWLFNKQALAFLSVFMLAFGGFLQATGHRSALADNLTSLRISVSVAANIRGAGSMECRVQGNAKEGLPSDYVIRWTQPGTARVDVQKDGEVRETLWVTNGDLVLVDHLKNTSRKLAGLEELRDSVFQPVLAFLSPVVIAENVDQRWQLERFEQERASRQGTLKFKNHERGSELEMTIDLDSYLPVRIRRIRPGREKTGSAEEVMRLDFTWNQHDPSPWMIPEIPRKNSNS